MNWQYVSGFLDADGSISYTTPRKGNSKTAQLSFHNNELSILKKIQKFIKGEIGVTGGITIKKGKKSNHRDSYDLKYQYRSAVEILKRVTLMHPKKRHRKNILIEIQKVKPRNGKYSDKMLKKISEIESRYK